MILAGRQIDTLFNSIYDATNKKTLRFLTAKCGSVQDIEDLFQETYEELYAVLLKRGPDYVENAEAFVLRIARQKLWRHYTIRSRLQIVSPPGGGGEEDADPLADLADPGLSAEDEACARTMAARIAGDLAAKPLITQKIFMMFYSLDMTIPQIAEELSVGESFVKNRLYRTVNELRLRYGGKEGGTV